MVICYRPAAPDDDFALEFNSMLSPYEAYEHIRNCETRRPEDRRNEQKSERRTNETSLEINSDASGIVLLFNKVRP